MYSAFVQHDMYPLDLVTVYKKHKCIHEPDYSTVYKKHKCINEPDYSDFSTVFSSPGMHDTMSIQ